MKQRYTENGHHFLKLLGRLVKDKASAYTRGEDKRSLGGEITNERKYKQFYLLIMTIYLFFVTTFLFTSCASTENVSSQFITTLNNKGKQKNSNLLFDRAYIADNNKNQNQESKLPDSSITNPIFFFENGLMLFSEMNFENLTSLHNWVGKYAYTKYSDNRWGTYIITNDTIRAIIYIGYYEKHESLGKTRLSESHFKGVISKNKIINWQLVNPFPEVDGKYISNNDYFERLKNPVNLGSINVSSNVDSKKAWINKFKD